MTEQQAGLLVPARRQHLTGMHGWFTDQRSCRQWAGPAFRFPFTEASFAEDCRIDQLASHVLLSKHRKLLAFGQYYPRLNRCHLGRLAVNPTQRGRGYGIALITALAATGTRQLGTSECSLFVLADNPAAVGLYRKLGFTGVDYPGNDFALENAIFMTVSHHRLQQCGHHQSPDSDSAGH